MALIRIRRGFWAGSRLASALPRFWAASHRLRCGCSAWIDSPNYVPAVIASMLLMSAIVAATYWLTRQRRFKLAANLFLYTTVAYVTLLIYLIGGVGGPMFVVYLIPIMAAGLFGKTGDGVRIFIISFSFYGLLALLQSQDSDRANCAAEQCWSLDCGVAGVCYGRRHVGLYRHALVGQHCALCRTER